MNKTKLFLVIIVLPLLGAACAVGEVGTQSASGRGVWLSADKGETWTERSLIYQDNSARRTIGDYDITQILFVPSDPEAMMAVARSVGLWFSWNNGSHWDNIFPAQGIRDAVIDPREPKTIYASVGGAIAKTENLGRDWQSVYTSSGEINLILSLAVNPTRPAIVLAGTSLGQIVISEDAGRSWREAAFFSGSRVEKIIFHPANPNFAYAGAAGHGLLRSRDGGLNWESLREKIKDFPTAAQFRDLAPIPSGLVYAANGILLRSLNQGENWSQLPLLSGRENSNILSLAVNPGGPSEIYYTTLTTIYRSQDGGVNWIPNALPTRQAGLEIVIDPNQAGNIYLGAGSFRP